MSEESKPVELTFEFASQAAAGHFADWLSGEGEQSYWGWMECREEEEPEGDITALSFFGKGSTANRVKTRCGRRDKGFHWVLDAGPST